MFTWEHLERSPSKFRAEKSGEWKWVESEEKGCYKIAFAIVLELVVLL